MCGDWNTAAVVLDSDPAVFSNGDVDGVTVTSKGFVYRVVDDLINQVVEAPWTGGADVHSWALTNRF